ncbi:hypothetical protein MTR_1g079465 [Medicago truncatula]|uniref:Uncharacterized protein n=1 Tax=Medicago truncatula TaxID=3880 RepID=A0A072VMD1_MEDTR|nr:hypothetical protein MTR_1g079465 [Medicago truncatula]
MSGLQMLVTTEEVWAQHETVPNFFLLQEKSSQFFLCTRAEQSYVVRWIVTCLCPFFRT